MFDRLTEHARQAIFYALVEARMRSSPWIETEHVLLGLLHDGVQGVSDRTRELLRKQFPPPSEAAASRHGDLPLSTEVQRVLGNAAEEAASIGSRAIETRHLVSGLLHVPECAAAQALHTYGIDYGSYRPPALAIDEPVAALSRLLNSASESLVYAENTGNQHLKRKPWTRKEALGHLIDCATCHHQWLARALIETDLVAGVPVSERWPIAQHYMDYPWTKLIDLWIGLNQLLIHVLSKFPGEKLSATCRIGIAEPVALKDLVAGYAAHCDDIIGQILSRL